MEARLEKSLTDNPRQELLLTVCLCRFGYRNLVVRQERLRGEGIFPAEGGAGRRRKSSRAAIVTAAGHHASKAAADQCAGHCSFELSIGTLMKPPDWKVEGWKASSNVPGRWTSPAASRLVPRLFGRKSGTYQKDSYTVQP
jgi:hypothetical protein